MTRHVVCETSFSPTKNSDTSDHMHRDTSDHLLLFHSVKPDFNQRGALPLSKLRDGSMYDGIRAPSVLIQRRICVEQKTGRTRRFRRDMAREPNATIETASAMELQTHRDTVVQCDIPCLPGCKSFHSSCTMLHPRYCCLLASVPAPWAWWMFVSRLRPFRLPRLFSTPLHLSCFNIAALLRTLALTSTLASTTTESNSNIFNIHTVSTCPCTSTCKCTR